MFTGIVEDVGEFLKLERCSKSARIYVKSDRIANSLKIGDSVSVNGVCLTAVKVSRNTVVFDLSFETLDRTTFKFLRVGSPLNLERALKVGDRLGGHIVQGHIDTVLKVMAIKRVSNAFEFRFNLPPAYRKFVVQKGSIAINGISLTIARVYGDSFSVAVIPFTYSSTNMKSLHVGNPVNVEFDIVGRYVERMVSLPISRI